MKDLRYCNDPSKVTRLVLVRYQNIGEVVKGALFCDDKYLCDTTEQNGLPLLSKGRYRISMSYHKAKIKDGNVTEGGWRVYLKKVSRRETVCRITDDEWMPIAPNIAIGWRMCGLEDLKRHYFVGSSFCLQTLAGLLSKMDCVIFHIIDACDEDIADLRSSPLWGVTADISREFNLTCAIKKNITIEELKNLNQLVK